MRVAHQPSIWRTVPLTLIVVLFCPLAHSKIIYVDDDANGADDGTTWINAYVCLQDALVDARGSERPVEICVAQGTYKPDQGANQTQGDREATFHLISGLILTGGFAGLKDADPDARDVGLYETILSGDLEGNDSRVNNVRLLHYDPNRIENSYHVVSAFSASGAVLDGFWISSGNADDEEEDSDHNRGGGFYCNAGNPLVVNCIFSKNTCNHYGAAICLRRQCRAEIASCEIFGNSTPDDGGGVFMSGSEYGKCSPLITDCVIRNNWAGDGSGGIRCDDYTEPIIKNSIISGNASRDEGGGISCKWTCWPHIENCTIIGNSSAYGGGLYCVETDVDMVNCIVWANVAKHGSQIALAPSDFYITRLSVLHCCVQGGKEAVYLRSGCETNWPSCGLSWLPGNVDADPCFVDPGRWDKNETYDDLTDDFWIQGDYHLQSEYGRYEPINQIWIADETTSPCINAGFPDTPVRAEPDPNGMRINIGAYGGTMEASKSPPVGGE